LFYQPLLLISTVTIMQSLILVCLCLAAVPISGLVHYPNGAAVPLDAANLAATNAHLLSKGLVHHPYIGYTGYPSLHWGRKKREAEADPLLIKYSNGAVAPFDPNVAVATANHYAAKALAGGYPFVGAAGVHPAAAVYPYAGAYLPYAGVAEGLVHLPNGAVVPVEPEENQKARAEHLAAKLALGRKKREADPALVYAAGLLPYGYGYPLVPLVAPFVHHPASGAIVPAEPLDVVKARAEHLKAHADATAAAVEA
jgi:hypothetical protein